MVALVDEGSRFVPPAESNYTDLSVTMKLSAWILISSNLFGTHVIR
jgi:hypothetical protein